jgi:hypothetical protein
VTIQTRIEQLETDRQSQVLVLAASQLEIELLPSLYEALSRLGPCQDLDVVFYSRGGVVNAARRIALLLREFAGRVRFLVPHYCESAGTVTALSADEITAGPLAIFSPIDPLLSSAGTTAGGGPLSLSAQDLRLFGEMSSEWFGLEPHEAKARALSVLCDNIFPSTLTSFYRATLEMQSICTELLSRHMADDGDGRQQAIAAKLIFGYHSHTYALTRDDLQALGLPIRADAAVEAQTWPIARTLRSIIGPGARASVEDDWFDAFIATRHGAVVRRRSEELPGRWQDWTE